jgi:exodeoxyribonuclease VII large subunit
MRSQMLDQLEDRMRRLIKYRLELLRAKLGENATALEALSPLSVLTRGYSIAQRLSDGEVITDTKQLEVDEKLRIILKSGQVTAKVEDITRAN